jgi:hypothetical protein
MNYAYLLQLLLQRLRGFQLVGRSRRLQLPLFLQQLLESIAKHSTFKWPSDGGAASTRQLDRTCFS